jgi:Tfp pilus assembly protein PilN
MLPATATATTPLLAAAMRQDTVAKALSLCQAAGLEPTMIDLDVFALANAAVLGTSALSPQTLLLDVQPTRTLLTLLQDAIPVYARSWTYGWQSQDISPEAYAARLGQHVQHTIYAYDNATDSSYTAEAILLSGRPYDELAALATELQKQLQPPLSSWNLNTAACTQIGSRAFSATEQPRYAVAFGAATRGLYRQAVGINLRREQFALHRNVEKLRGHLIALSCLTLLVLGLGLGKLYFDNRIKAQHHARLQQEITHIFQTTLPNTPMKQPAFQLREQVIAMQNRLRAFGGLDGARLSVLQTLREISAQIPSSLTLNVDTLTMTPTTVDMSGTTTSYDDVVKLKDALESSPAIATVKINTTKATTANQVTFQLTISAAQQQGDIS